MSEELRIQVSQLRIENRHLKQRVAELEAILERKPKPTPPEPQAKKPRVPLAEIPGYVEGLHHTERYAKAIRQAHRRGKKWGLTREQWEQLVALPCDYCGAPTGNGVGLDRVDNDLGYLPGNVVPCCTICNNIRNKHPRGRMLTSMHKIATETG